MMPPPRPRPPEVRPIATWQVGLIVTGLSLLVIVIIALVYRILTILIGEQLTQLTIALAGKGATTCPRAASTARLRGLRHGEHAAALGQVDPAAHRRDAGHDLPRDPDGPAPPDRPARQPARPVAARRARVLGRLLVRVLRLSRAQGERCPGRLRALTITQIRAQLDAKHPIVLPGDYNQIRIVSANSFDTKTPARGRVQKYLSTHPFGHMVTAWESLKSSTEGRYGYIVSDPDFGSYSGAPVPPHSIWSDTDLEAFWGLLEWDVCYAITMPPALNVPTPPPPAKPDPNAPVYKYGGRPTSRGSYMVPAGVRIRHDPHVRAGNVIKTTTKPTSFAASQATYAGTNVAGSTLWLGTADGNSWVFKDLTKLVGHTTGREDIR
jgi:hypothetical protein